MKKLLHLFLITFFALGFTLNTKAQPNLTAANFSPVLGDHFILKMGNYMQPGNPGANQTWNFSSLAVTSTMTTDYVSRSAAPYPASVPSATLVSKTSNNEYEYIATTSSAIKTYGAYSGPQNVFITYSNPLEIALPKTYNTSSTDVYKATYTANNMTFVRTGSMTATYDGYGTVITPAGTYNNVIRLKMADVVRDSTNIGGGFPYIVTTMLETYDYILPGTHAPVARMVKVTSGASTQTRGIFLDASSIITGQSEELAQEMNLQIYPNPASTSATLQYQLKKSGQVKITLVNLVGQEVKQLQNSLQTTEMQTQSIPVNDLPKGVYFVKIDFENQVAIKRLVIQ